MSTAAVPAAGAAPTAPGRAVRAWCLVRSDRGLFVGVCVISFIVVLAVVGPWIVSADPYATSADVRVGPSRAHLLGTDSVGRDMLARVIGGLGYSLQVVAITTALTALIGLTLGLLAGYLGGNADWAAMRATDIMLAVPSLMVAIAALASFGPRMSVLIVVLVSTLVPLGLRVARSAALQLRGREYVLAARLSNVGHFDILRTHVFPNSRATLLVYTTLTAAVVLLIETSLSFLGLGAQSPEPSLGGMIADGQIWMEVSPHMILVPTAFVVVVISAVTAVGNGLDRALAKQATR